MDLDLDPREEGLLVYDEEFCRKEGKSAKCAECVVSAVVPPLLTLLLLLLFVLSFE